MLVTRYVPAPVRSNRRGKSSSGFSGAWNASADKKRAMAGTRSLLVGQRAEGEREDHVANARGLFNDALAQVLIRDEVEKAKARHIECGSFFARTGGTQKKPA